MKKTKIFLTEKKGIKFIKKFIELGSFKKLQGLRGMIEQEVVKSNEVIEIENCLRKRYKKEGWNWD